MIKFFRQIRKKLIDKNEGNEVLSEQNQSEVLTERTVKREGRIKRYLIYAIGEILLVVIGILIALQINNWNKNNSNRAEEKISLHAISEKMKFNQFQYEIGLKRNKRVILGAEELLTLASDPTTKMSNSRIEQNLNTLNKRFLMGKSNATSIYDELVGAGQFSNISSQELRNQLTKLKANMQLLESYENLQIQFVDNHLSPFLNTQIDKVAVGITGSKADSTFYDKKIQINYSAFNKLTKEQSYEELLRSREFSNLLLELMKHTKTLLPIYDRIGGNISIIDSIVGDANK